jgi:hypothetical protein
MSDAQTVPHRQHASRRAGCLALVIAALSCVPMQQPGIEAVELVLLPAQVAAPAGLSPIAASGPVAGRVPLTPNSITAVEFLRMDVPRERTWIAARTTLPRDSFPYSTPAAVLGFGGPARDAAAVMRVLHADTSWRQAAAADFRRATAMVAARTVIIVPGALSAREFDVLFATSAELAAGARAGGATEVWIAVPGSDTAAYPSRMLAGIANALLVSIEPPGSTPAPGPPVTQTEMRRTVTLRASEIGLQRLVLLLPLHGYVWPRDSLPRPVSFEEGSRLASEWRTPLVRDAASETLYARSGDRGEIWLVDARVIARITREARAIGVRRFAVVLGAGEDPAIPDSLAASLQTTGNSRW